MYTAGLVKKKKKQAAVTVNVRSEQKAGDSSANQITYF